MPPLAASAGGRLSHCWVALELHEDLRVDPIAEFADHRIGTLLP
jgi:hypothetical protein